MAKEKKSKGEEPVKEGDKYLCPHCKMQVPVKKDCPACKATIDWSKV
jgi:primosomal protein N'